MLCVLQPSRNSLLLILLFFYFQLPLYAENSYWNRFIGMILVGSGFGLVYHAGVKHDGARRLVAAGQSCSAILRSVGAVGSIALVHEHYKQWPPFFISVKNLATQYTHELMLIGGVTACASGAWLFFKKSDQKVPKQDTPQPHIENVGENANNNLMQGSSEPPAEGSQSRESFDHDKLMQEMLQKYREMFGSKKK